MGVCEEEDVRLRGLWNGVGESGLELGEGWDMKDVEVDDDEEWYAGWGVGGG